MVVKINSILAAVSYITACLAFISWIRIEKMRQQNSCQSNRAVKIFPVPWWERGKPAFASQGKCGKNDMLFQQICVPNLCLFKLHRGAQFGRWIYGWDERLISQFIICWFSLINHPPSSFCSPQAELLGGLQSPAWGGFFKCICIYYFIFCLSSLLEFKVGDTLNFSRNLCLQVL